VYRSTLIILDARGESTVFLIEGWVAPESVWKPSRKGKSLHLPAIEFSHPECKPSHYNDSAVMVHVRILQKLHKS
jgi:hypothetical protein